MFNNLLCVYVIDKPRLASVVSVRDVNIGGSICQAFAEMLKPYFAHSVGVVKLLSQVLSALALIKWLRVSLCNASKAEIELCP